MSELKSGILTSFDVLTMLNPPKTSQDLVVGGAHLGRGSEYANENESTLCKYTTESLDCWEIADNYLSIVPTNANNHLYDSESYLIKWEFAKDIYDLKTNKSLGGNKNVLYFHWRGENAPKGYSPLPEDAGDVDDSPPVERLVQWSEPPAFLRLFAGKFIIHRGRRSDPYVFPRLYILRGDLEEELNLIEVPCVQESLRSRTSFVLVDENNAATIWNGCKSNKGKLAVLAVQRIFPDSIIGELQEGSESDDFLNKVLGKKTDYFSLLNNKKEHNYVPRLFYFNSISGDFCATEIENSLSSEEITPYPFLQSHLYTAHQPALFLLDDFNEIWIWKGWECLENRASANYAEEFDAVKEISRKYAEAKGMENISIQIVHAGHEPLAFKNLFPVWILRPDITEEQLINGIEMNAVEILQ